MSELADRARMFLRAEHQGADSTRLRVGSRLIEELVDENERLERGWYSSNRAIASLELDRSLLVEQNKVLACPNEGEEEDHAEQGAYGDKE